MNREIKCDGCELLSESVKRYSVKHNKSGHDWGEFNYCEKCAEEDRNERDMTVTPPKELN